MACHFYHPFTFYSLSFFTFGLWSPPPFFYSSALNKPSAHLQSARLCSYYYTLLTHAATTMPFREKMRRAFGTRPSDEGSELFFTQTPSSSSRRSRKEKKTRRSSSSNVYRPGEIMPKPKYPLAYNKAHQDKLLAYNFGDAWKKRKSVQSQYISPLGSRWPSARTSVAISRQQSYSAATPDRAADDGAAKITMNGDHSYLQAGNGEYSSRPLCTRDRTRRRIRYIRQAYVDTQSGTMLTVVCVSWCKGVALSLKSIHADEYHEKQKCEDSREQVHLPSGADSQLDELQPLPPLTTGVYLNGVELGDPLFTEEELTLAMTRTTISPWIEGAVTNFSYSG